MDGRIRGRRPANQATNVIILDAGPLVSMLSERDQFHFWAVEQSKQVAIPWYTCEAVLTEAFFLLGRVPHGREKLLAALRKPDLILPSWNFDENRTAVLNLIEKYANVPASLADACLVRMAESVSDPVIWTTDAHFSLYRLRGNRAIPTISPSD